MTNTTLRLLAVGCLSGAALATSQGKEPVAGGGGAASPWDVSLDAGVNFTDGNTDSLGVTAGLVATRIRDYDETYLGAGLSYGELNGARTSESIFAYAQYNRLLSDRLYLGGRGDFLYDDITALDYRVGAHGLLGYYLIKNETTSLAIEAGAGYQWEDQSGQKDAYAVARFAERFEHQLSPSLRFWQTAEFTPAIDDFNNYTALIRVGLETGLGGNWSLKTYIEDRYDNHPADGFEKNDFGVYSALSYSLAGSSLAPAVSSGKGGKGGMLSGGGGGGPWDVSLFGGVSFTEGNTDTLLVSADFLANGSFDGGEAFLGLGGSYGEVDDAVSAQRLYAFGQYNKYVGESFYLGERISFLHDDVGGINWRVEPALVAGVYLIDNETTSLALEVGPSYVFEELSGAGSDSYFSVYAAERFTHQLSDTVAIYQSVSASIDVSNTDNYLIDAQAGIDVKLSDRISWRTAVQNLYDNEPAAGSQDNDFRVTSGFAMKF